MLGNTIKYLRLKNRLTQAELAHKAGLTRSHISGIENNRIPNPGSAAIIRLANAFEVPEDALFHVEDSERADPTSDTAAQEEEKSDLYRRSFNLNSIIDFELREMLKPEILNSLSPDITRAIVAIIRESHRPHLHLHHLAKETFLKEQSEDSREQSTEALAKSTQPDNYLSACLHHPYLRAGRFVVTT